MSEGRETQFKEHGLPILKDTGCKVGAHAFVWTSSGKPNGGLDPTQRCLCGLLTWKETHAS